MLVSAAKKRNRSGVYTAHGKRQAHSGRQLPDLRKSRCTSTVDDLMQRFGMTDQILKIWEERMASFPEEAGASGALAPIDQDGEDEVCPRRQPGLPVRLGAQGAEGDAQQNQSATAKRRRPPPQVSGYLL